MKIAIDAYAISHPQTGGFKTVVSNLVQGFSQIECEEQFVLFFDREVATERLGLGDNFSTRVIGSRIPILHMVIREQLALPRAIARDGCDVAHFPYNTAPLSYRGLHVVTVNDVTAATYSPPIFRRPFRKTLWAYAILRYARTVMPRTAARADAVITPSESEKQRIHKHLDIPLSKIHVTYMAASRLFRRLPDSERMRIRARLMQQHGIMQPYVLGVGAQPLKNLEGILEGFAKWDVGLQRHHMIVLVMANDNYAQQVHERAQALGLERKVVLLGSQSAAQMVELYNCAAALAFVSFRESFGMPTIEAMACGVPVIASSRPALPETVGNAALLVEPDDYSGIAAATSRVLTDGELRAELIERGFQRARFFSWERTAAATLQVYRLIGA
jgi:glycosyltransferase involved in cell wall biosynthesis